MFTKIVGITILLIIAVSFSGCFLTESATPDTPFDFSKGVIDGLFFSLRLIIKCFQPIDLFADYHTGGYTVGYLMFAIPQLLEVGLAAIALTVWLLGSAVGKTDATPSIDA